MRIHVLTILAVGLLAGSGLAQTQPNTVWLSADCDGDQIAVSVELHVVDPLPTGWIGWVVEYTTLGSCGPVELIADPQPFPEGSQTFTFHVDPDPRGLTHDYRIRAVDSDGNRYALDYPHFDATYSTIAFGACGQEAPMARGRVVDNGYGLGLVCCPDNCWLGLADFQSDPVTMAILQSLIGTNTVVDLYGTMGWSWEGASGWVDAFAVVEDCGVVATESTSWGALKSTYR